MFVFEHLEHHHEYLNLSLSTKHTIINFGGQGNLALCVYSWLLITSVNPLTGIGALKRPTGSDLLISITLF